MLLNESIYWEDNIRMREGYVEKRQKVKVIKESKLELIKFSVTVKTRFGYVW